MAFFKTKKSFSLMPEITEAMDRERMQAPKKTCTGFRRLRSHWDAQGRRKTAKPRNHSSIEHHHAGDHEHWVPVEHEHSAIPGKATTPVLHPVGSEEDAH